MQPFLLSILVSFVASLIITPLVRQFFMFHGWIEDPITKHQKTHNATALTAVPRGGGLPIFAAVTLASVIFLPLEKHLIGILLAALLTLMVGLWDDLKDISPKFRLATNLLAAIIVVASGIGIAYLSHPLGGVIDLSQPQINFNFFGNHSIWVIPDILAIIWIVWCMNITGWSAGIEGQLPGFVAISAIFIGILSLKFSGDISEWPVIILAGAIAGAYFGFLPYNFYPQSIMPGYSGKSLAGFFLAVLAILSGAKLATIVLLLAIPMIDAVVVLLRRLWYRRPLLLSDGQHLHHLLLKSGWSRPQIAVFYWLLSLVLGITTLFIGTLGKLIVFLILVVFFLAFLFKVSRRI